MAQSIQDQLKELKKSWKSVKPKEAGQFSRIPDGDYVGSCKTARLGNSKNSGRLQIEWMFRVSSPKENKGEPIRFYTGLETEDNLAWCKGIFKAMGMKPPKNILNLPSVLDKCLEKEAMLRVQTNGEFQNVYVNPPDKTPEEAEEEEDLEMEDL